MFFLTDSDLVGEKGKILLCSIFSHVRHRKSAEITSVYWLLNSKLFAANAAYVFVCMWLWSSQSPHPLSCLFFKWCFDFPAFFFFPLSPRGGRGDNVCANLLCVSCVSVQSGNDTGRIKKPQSDAISEYVYSGVKQNLNRPFRPRDFSV